MFSVLFSFVESLLIAAFVLINQKPGMIWALFLIVLFAYAFIKRDTVLQSSTWKWAVLTLSSLFVIGTLGSMLAFLVLPLLG